MSSDDDVIDPVCGMKFDRRKAPFVRELGEQTFYLCSSECAKKFDVDGEAYAATSRLNLPGWGETPHPDNIVKQFRQH
jgi:YHS domain-containing protein